MLGQTSDAYFEVDTDCTDGNVKESVKSDFRKFLEGETGLCSGICGVDDIQVSCEGGGGARRRRRQSSTFKLSICYTLKANLNDENEADGIDQEIEDLESLGNIVSNEIANNTFHPSNMGIKPKPTDDGSPVKVGEVVIKCRDRGFVVAIYPPPDKPKCGK